MVATPLGTVSELGTQFEVRLVAEGLRVRVREGEVALRRLGRTHTADAGVELTVTAAGVVHTAALPAFGAAWEWTQAIAPPFPLEGSSLSEFLAWVSRESGRRVAGSAMAAGEPARATVLHGSLAGLTPEESLAVVLPSCGLGFRLDDASIRIGRNRARGLAMRRCPGAAVALLLLAVAAWSAFGAARRADLPAPRYAGRPLAEALDELRSQGLDLVWSSALVRPEMRVAAEPRGGTPRAVLDEVLAPFALAVRAGPDGRLVIVAGAGEPSAGALAGTVRRADTGEPVAGAEIVLPEAGRRARSGRDGGYRIDRLPPGSYRVLARLPGFVVGEASAGEVVAGADGRVDFDLVPAPVTVDEIVVTPNRYAILGDDPAGREALGRARVEALPHLADDLFRVLPWLPGVAAGDLSAQIHVRGGEEDETLVELDGMRLYDPFHFKDFQSVFSLINAQAIGGVEFLSGGFPAQYGDRLSGVIDLTSATPGASRRTELGVSFTHLLATTEGSTRSGRAGWLVSARRGYLDLVLDLVGTAEAQLDPRYYDAFAKFETAAGARTRLAAEALASGDALHFALDTGEEQADAAYGDRYFWVSAQTAWSPRLVSSTLASVAEVDRDRRGTVTSSDVDAAVDDQRNFRALGVEQEWSLQPSARWLLRGGAEVRRLTASYDYASLAVAHDPLFPRGAAERRLELEPDGDADGAFASLRLRLSPTGPSSWAAAGTASPTPPTGRPARGPTPSGSRSPDTTLHFAWGRFAQSQGIDELQIEDGVDRYLPAQWSEHRVLGFEQDLGRGIHLAVTGYQKLLSHLRPRYENLFTPLNLLPEAEPDRVRVAPESGRAEGVEVAVRSLGAGPVSWSAAYTWSSASDRIDGRWVPRSWDQRHAVVANAEVRLGHAWRLAAGAVYHSGWPTTAVSAAVAAGPARAPALVYTVGERNAARNPYYQRLDLRAVRNLSVPRGELSLVLEVTNLLDRDNVCCVDEFIVHRRPDGSVSLERRDVGWLPRVPSFGVSWRF